MTFTRTNTGLSNLRLFKGVDLVVFVEGGGPNVVSVEDALSGIYYKFAKDIEFWRPIFSRFRSNLSVSFRAIGTKNTLKEIAIRLSQGSVSGICVAMDRDFDELFGNMIYHNRVLYTHKYSWESELFETRVILHAFRTIAFSEISERNLEQKIRPIVGEVRHELRHFVRADAILCAAGKPLFRRKGAVAALKAPRKNQPPSLDLHRIKAQLRTYHAEVRGYVLLRSLGRIDVRRHCFGKLLLAAAIQTMHFLIEWREQPKLRNEYCTSFLIRAFHTWLAERPGSGAARYYSRVVAAI